MSKKQFKPRRKTAAEILAGIPRSEWATPFACRACGTIGCRPELHEDAVPAVRVPLVGRLLA